MVLLCVRSVVQIFKTDHYALHNRLRKWKRKIRKNNIREGKKKKINRVEKDDRDIIDCEYIFNEDYLENICWKNLFLKWTWKYLILFMEYDRR